MDDEAFSRAAYLMNFTRLTTSGGSHYHEWNLCTNSLDTYCPKFISENINLCLHFLLFFNYEMVKVFEILSHIRWGPGDHFTIYFSIVIQIRWKFHSALIQVIVKWWLWNIAHSTTTVLSCHVQNSVAIWYHYMELHSSQFSIELELRQKIAREFNLAPQWPMTSVHYTDVIMGAMAYQITSVLIVYSAVCSSTNQRKHHSSASLALHSMTSSVAMTLT